MPNSLFPGLPGTTEQQQTAPNDTSSGGGNSLFQGLPSAQTTSQPPTGAQPSDVQTADSQQGNTDLNGFCETAVERWAKLPKMGATAQDAWGNWAQQGKAKEGLQGAQPGDLLYFSGNNSNSNEGHAALFEGYDPKGNPVMVSATDNGIARSDVNEWSKNVAPLLGYVHP
jgi:cell wall-associated NlpC family hydrolase